jgi:hypothetical protein
MAWIPRWCSGESDNDAPAWRFIRTPLAIAWLQGRCSWGGWTTTGRRTEEQGRKEPLSLFFSSCSLCSVSFVLNSSVLQHSSRQSVRGLGCLLLCGWLSVSVSAEHATNMLLCFVWNGAGQMLSVFLKKQCQ